MDRSRGYAPFAAYADPYGRIQRKLFAEVSVGRSAPFVEAEVLGVAPDTGSDVQQGAGVPGREDHFRQGDNGTLKG